MVLFHSYSFSLQGSNIEVLSDNANVCVDLSQNESTEVRASKCASFQESTKDFL